MNRELKVLVACGAGIATSTVVMQKLEDLFKQNNIRVSLIQIKISEAAGRQQDADMLVSTSLLPTAYRIPAVVAMGYLTGLGKDKLDAKIIDTAREILDKE
ncbi:PTS system, galactitol-specific IIB component [Propionibacterium cyclohexanicum]|uniref:PTS system, galactitol-specific IIB component n=1 Tax=Propionibacterium cyclohexanicum TaxID=64702 RepID=A0A1H9TQ43_9ACTN|nr:PTS sugar transporter subunit IIB [Propionibacterium cyclohexanicum]SER99171.1 PTS system, galactitol-specific IIB component [Propionibacterium cyclohexanicum]